MLMLLAGYWRERSCGCGVRRVVHWGLRAGRVCMVHVSATGIALSVHRSQRRRAAASERAASATHLAHAVRAAPFGSHHSRYRSFRCMKGVPSAVGMPESKTAPAGCYE